MPTGHRPAGPDRDSAGEKCPQLDVAGVLTHFSTADLPEAQGLTASPTMALPIDSIGGTMFHGVAGKREAVMMFLNAVLASERPLDLLLHSAEDMEWLTGERSYYLRWAAMLTEAICRGHRVKIIHDITRDPASIRTVMDQWIPLHLTGRIESYYSPTPSERLRKTSLLVACGVAAVAAVSIGGDEDNGYTFLFTDAAATANAEHVFRSFLAPCRRLARTFTDPAMQDYAAELEALERLPGRYTVLTDRLPVVTMPTALQARLINRSALPESEKQRRIALHERRLATLCDASQTEPWTVICATGRVLRHPGRDPRRCATAELGEVLPAYSESEYREHILHVVRLLKEHDRFRVVLAPNLVPPGGRNVTLTAKSGAGVILERRDKDGRNPVALMVNADSVTTAFEEFLLAAEASVPEAERTKEYTIHALEEYVQQLS